MKLLNHLFTLPQKSRMHRLYFLSLAGNKKEIRLVARDPKSDGAREFHGYFVVEWSERGAIESFGCVEVGDIDAHVCDRHVDIGFEVGNWSEYILLEMWMK